MDVSDLMNQNQNQKALLDHKYIQAYILNPKHGTFKTRKRKRKRKVNKTKYTLQVYKWNKIQYDFETNKMQNRKTIHILSSIFL